MSEKYNSVETQASYGVGFQMGEQLKSNPFDGLDINAVVEGLQDAFTGQTAQVDNNALRSAFAEIHQRMQAAKAEESKGRIEEGEKFLTENAQREEIQVTDTGLQYEVIATGEGEKPNADSTVRVHYHGTFLDGSMFDSSVERGQPAEFPVNGVIKGWTEALQMMTAGSKWRLYVPHELAYGEQGAGGAIPPYTTLVFDVELLDILA